jgi:hypothetical protein
MFRTKTLEIIIRRLQAGRAVYLQHKYNKYSEQRIGYLIPIYDKKHKAFLCYRYYTLHNDGWVQLDKGSISKIIKWTKSIQIIIIQPQNLNKLGIPLCPVPKH